MADNDDSPSPPLKYDLIILGASGFTGKYVLKEALKFLNNPSSPLKALAIAGRNPTKLAQTLSWATHQNPNPPTVPILTADTSSLSSLLHLCSLSRLILNCVGPFRLHGDPVVKACVETGCDYLDISGEPEFMEKMELVYHDQAVEKGSLVISACGFDSVPAELGLLFNSRQWVVPSVPNRVEAYLSLESERRIVGNLATYESAVLGVAHADVLRELRKSRPKRARPQKTLESLSQLILICDQVGWLCLQKSHGLESTLFGKQLSTLGSRSYVIKEGEKKKKKTVTKKYWDLELANETKPIRDNIQ